MLTLVLTLLIGGTGLSIADDAAKAGFQADGNLIFRDGKNGNWIVAASAGGLLVRLYAYQPATDPESGGRHVQVSLYAVEGDVPVAAMDMEKFRSEVIDPLLQSPRQVPLSAQPFLRVPLRKEADEPLRWVPPSGDSYLPVRNVQSEDGA